MIFSIQKFGATLSMLFVLLLRNPLSWTSDNYIKISKKKWMCLIYFKWNLTNFNILFLINGISSNIINCDRSYFLPKLFNCYELNDGKSLQLKTIEGLEWIVALSILNVFFLIYVTNKGFFLNILMRVNVIKT